MCEDGKAAGGPRHLLLRGNFLLMGFQGQSREEVSRTGDFPPESHCQASESEGERKRDQHTHPQNNTFKPTLVFVLCGGGGK